MAIRETLARINRARKKVGELIGSIGVATLMTPVMLAVIVNLVLCGLDGAWILLGHQASTEHIWIDRANYQIEHGYLYYPFFGTFWTGLLLFFLGWILSVGKRVR